ncbi:phosphatase PAP2 family protein [Gymnodinialimonas sp. 2305UL16-5]|uniref:phosphatase PAP2 family protein n=1 Tax=Gymnodinialimonas mytili TaxID=3126503 RepID=UPI0030AD7FEA
MDEVLFLWLNALSGLSPVFDGFLSATRMELIKSVPFMLALWGLWFWDRDDTERRQRRERLLAALFCAVPIIGVTRAIANATPFSARPIHTEGLEINLIAGQSASALEGWSSMPSDHASLFFGFALAILMIHRSVGWVLLIWAVIVVSIPRVILGLHWPSDILAGWALGGALALLLMRPVTALVEASRIVPYFERREMIGFPLLFLATYEFAQMFGTVRVLISRLIT